MSKYYFQDGAFVIEGFDKAKTFSSFLPGLVGIKGIPMWIFYVNRGQAISSFGIRDKNTPIVEFSPANVSYKLVAGNGFRTFIKLPGDGGIYEPFQSFREDVQAKRIMRIRPNEVSIEETHVGHGLRIRVTYFNMPGEDYAALVRHVELVNCSGRELQLELLDGLPEILPAGVDNSGYKSMANLLRSWMEVYNLDNRVPFYKVRSSTHDEAEVSEVNNGHFYLSFCDEGQLVKPIVDFELVFGSNTALAYPERFAATPLDQLAAAEQITANKVPCGFTGKAATLAAGASLNLYTLIGHVNGIEKLNARAERLASAEYIRLKRQEANQLAEALTSEVATKTSSPLFDEYCRQNYMDNFLRGGYPLVLDNGGDGFVYHVFSRKHGDMEREYNFFSLAPEYYSQGNGNFRDMNQNRRNDVFFHPEVGAFNVNMFFSLIQADGYNPLSVEGSTFRVPAERMEELRQWLEGVSCSHTVELVRLCSMASYTPGRVVHFLADHQVKLAVGEEELLAGLMRLSEQQLEASFGEGYWIDHWTYNMDLVDNYLSIFPDKKAELLLKPDTCTFFDSPARVLPRSMKYGLSGGRVRQYGSVVPDEEKLQRLGLKPGDTSWLRTGNGTGGVYRTSLLVKMISLALNKFSTLDPEGMGIEMEANKPGWNDAMNGLPGLIGSGMSETFELKRLLMFILQAAKEGKGTPVQLPEEIHDFLLQVDGSVTEYYGSDQDNFRYWDRTAAMREAYRERIRFGISGLEQDISLADLEQMTSRMIRKLDQGIEQAIRLGKGLPPTYFCFEAVSYEPVLDDQGKPVLGGYGLPQVRVKAFAAKPLPYFLEGPARWMKQTGDQKQAAAAYRQIKETELYDPAIRMYKTSVSLEGESHEIGRMRAFTPGWLERESVFLHMSYKYLLSLLKAGLYEEFFAEIRDSLVPFLDPAVYGRSTIENSSFIASSVNPDPHVHGRGFVARLSGSTAEFLSMWIGMMAGKHPFQAAEGVLSFKLEPKLPGWLFDEQGEVTFTFLGKTSVTYRNPRKADTYGADGACIRSMVLYKASGEAIQAEGDSVRGQTVSDIRAGKYASIVVELA
ncbi:MAG: cellobiose phosphorylase [Paenibacillaceae bacterium]|jgi:hypothetical protein|nr:cellobiose phosphorylase [Paenibacillaceae bacterium]